jgi:hypothetical protein
MTTKTLYTRIVNKHETEEHWLAATGFTPLEGEVIVYCPDDKHPYARLKVGNNIDNVNDLPFITHNSNGGKAYKILSYNFTTSQVLDPNVSVYEGSTTLILNTVEGISVGNIVNIEMNDSSQRFATVQNIDNSQNTVILSKAFFDESIEVGDVSNSNCFLVLPELENKGDSLIGDTGYNFGINNRTLAEYTFVTGEGNSAEGRNAFVSGENNIGGYNALVGGEDNVISAEHGFGVGYKNTATARYAAAIGYNNKATGPASMAIGDNTTASGVGSFSQGYNTKATGHHSHAEGAETEAIGIRSHAEGFGGKSEGYASHAEGAKTEALEDFAHAEGYKSEARGIASHAEGDETIANTDYSHAEGMKTQAIGIASHAEGAETNASYPYSHAEGHKTKTSNTAAHAEGESTTASGEKSHAEGIGSTASGSFSHAENCYTEATGPRSHAEGNRAKAYGESSHAGGSYSEANGAYAFAHGFYAKTTADHQIALGKLNLGESDSLFEIGNGTSQATRANAFSVKTDNSVYAGTQKLATENYVNSRQADWNESNANVAGYIKNRTHYGLQNPEISIPYDVGYPYGQSTYYYDLVSKDGQYIHVHRYNAFGLDEWYKLCVDRSDYFVSDDTPPSPGLAFVEVASKFKIASCGYPHNIWHDSGTIGIEEYDNTQCVYDIYNELVPAEKVLDPRYLPMNVITEGVKSGVSEEIDSKLASLIDSAPETLNTLNELADALGNDPNFATTVATEIGKKVDKVEGKGLSTNDFTNEYKTKLDNIDSIIDIDYDATLAFDTSEIIIDSTFVLNHAVLG